MGRRLTLVMLVGSACVVDTDVAPRAAVSCESSRDCPEGLVCLANVGRCSDPDPTDETPPGLTSATTLPDRVRAGTELVLALQTDEALIVDPEVVLIGSAGAWPWTLDETGTDRNSHAYACAYVVTGAEGASGEELRVEVTLVDRTGNESTREVDRLVLDLDAPRLLEFTWTLPDWKRAARNEEVDFTARVEAPATISAMTETVGGDPLASAPVTWTTSESSGELAIDGTLDLSAADLAVVPAITIEFALADDLGNTTRPGDARSGFLAIDVVAPTTPEVVVPAVTETQQIEVWVSAVGASSFQFTGDVFDATIWYETEPPTTQSILLSPGLGEKTFRVVFGDAAGNLLESDPVTVEWVPVAVDETPPGVTLVTAANATTVDVAFTEEVNPATAALLVNYTIDGLTVESAVLQSSNQSVRLTTSEEMLPATPYQLTVVGVEDVAGNAMPAEDHWFFGYGDADESAPELLYPADGAVLQIADPDEGSYPDYDYDANMATTYQAIDPPTLSWTPRIGATSYTVTVGLDAGFASEIPGSPFTVDAPETTLRLVPQNAETEVAGRLPADTPLEARTYYWKVVADVTVEPAQEHSFVALANTIYVHCPGSEPTCSPGAGRGNFSEPYHTISAGTAAATAIGIQRVLVAERGGTDAYPGPVHIESGVSVFGGYTSTFAEGDRDVDNQRAIVRSSASFALFALDVLGQSTVVEGLELYGADGGDTYGILALNSDQSLVFRNCGAYGGETDDASRSVGAYNERLSPDSGPQYQSVHLEGGAAKISIAFVASAADVAISDSTLIGGEGLHPGGVFYPLSKGVDLRADSAVVIANSTVHADPVSAFGYGLGVGGSGDAELVGSTVTALGMDVHSHGISLSDGSLVVDDVTIVSDGFAVNVDTELPGTVVISHSNLSSFNQAAMRVDAHDLLVDTQIRQSTLLGETFCLGLDTAGSVELTNSVLRAEEAAGDLVASGGAVWAEQAGTLLLSNNTIVAKSTGDSCTAFDFDEGNAILANNIIAVEGGATRVGLNVDTLGQILSLENNLFWDVSAAAGYDPYLGNIDNILGNLTLPLTDSPFVDYANDDYHLSQNALIALEWLNIRFGGKDTSQATCGNGSQSCGDVLFDRDGNPRTTGSTGGVTVPNAAGYSMGAYEQD